MKIAILKTLKHVSQDIAKRHSVWEKGSVFMDRLAPHLENVLVSYLSFDNL